MDKYRVVLNIRTDDPKFGKGYRRNCYLLIDNKAFVSFDAVSKEKAIASCLESVNDPNWWGGLGDHIIFPITLRDIIGVDHFWQSKKDGLNYWLCEDGTAELSGASIEDNSNFLKLLIPDTLLADGNEYKITVIGCGAFEDYEHLNFVRFPIWLEAIRESAFCGCNLSEVVIDNIVTFGKYAFDCESLRRINVKTSMSIDETLEAFGMGFGGTNTFSDLIDITIVSLNNSPYTFNILDIIGSCCEYEDEERNVTIISNGSVSLAPENFEVFEEFGSLPFKVLFMSNECNYTMEVSFRSPLINPINNTYFPLISFIPGSNNSANIELDLDQIEDFSDFDIE